MKSGIEMNVHVHVPGTSIYKLSDFCCSFSCIHCNVINLPVDRYQSKSSMCCRSKCTRYTLSWLLSFDLGSWPFGEFMCAVWIFFDYGMTFASVFTLVVISLDRCDVAKNIQLRGRRDAFLHNIRVVHVLVLDSGRFSGRFRTEITTPSANAST